MYYDEIIDKMITRIFILINNKTNEGYKDVFFYIKYYLEYLFKNRQEEYKFETFSNAISQFKSFKISMFSLWQNLKLDFTKMVIKI